MPQPPQNSPFRFGPSGRPGHAGGLRTGRPVGPVMRNAVVPVRSRPQAFALRRDHAAPGVPQTDPAAHTPAPLGQPGTSPTSPTHPTPPQHAPAPRDEAVSGFDELPVRELLQRLHRDVSFAKAVVVTTMPRGGLQPVLPGYVDESLCRALARGLHAHDRVAWAAITRGSAASHELWPDAELEASPLTTELLAPLRLGHHAAVRLREPVLPGYDGALVLYREAGADPLGDREMTALREFAASLEEQMARLHPKGDATHGLPLAHDLPQRLFAFDAEGRCLLPSEGLAAVEAKSGRLAHVMAETATRAIAKHTPGSKNAAPGGRVPLSDDLGDRWATRVTVFDSYPALGVDGPVAFVAVQPSVSQWAALRPGHFPADEELARLVPALRFMFDHYAEGPSLERTSKVVHLSPFHFHRRFSELLGVTPKHYLFDCQIAVAKSKLVADEELARIADDCGFAHQSHFTSRFKQATGLTPTRWRKLARSQG